jgi:NADH-quinone oxidoreductase subunit M
MVKRVFFGPVVSEHVEVMQDINWIEKLNYILLGAGVFFIGLYPEPVLNVLHATVGHLLNQSLPAANTMLALNSPPV